MLYLPGHPALYTISWFDSAGSNFALLLVRQTFTRSDSISEVFRIMWFRIFALILLSEPTLGILTHVPLTPRRSRSGTPERRENRRSVQTLSPIERRENRQVQTLADTPDTLPDTPPTLSPATQAPGHVPPDNDPPGLTLHRPMTCMGLITYQALLVQFGGDEQRIREYLRRGLVVETAITVGMLSLHPEPRAGDEQRLWRVIEDPSGRS